QRFVGSDNQGIYVSKNMSYEKLMSIVHTVVKYDVNKYNVNLQSISIVPGPTCRTFVRIDNDVQFMLGKDRVIPQVFVSLIERATGDVIQNDIHAPENTQQFGSASGSNQVFTQRSATEGGENICVVEPVVVNHADVGEPQFVYVFGCRFEMNDGRYNEQYNEMYNEQNTKPNLGPNQEVDNKAYIDLVDHVKNTDEDHVQIQICGRRVEGVSCTGADMPSTSEVRHNISADDSDNTTTWVILRADSYSFGIDRSTTLVAEEPTSMIYKAVRRDEGTYFQVRSFINEHTCPLEEIHRRHRQASAVIIGEVVAPRLQQQDSRLMRPKDIIADMKTMYGIQIMYSKAHQALHYALSLTYGTHEETFQLLPSFGYVLEQQNPDTITDLQSADDCKCLYFFMSLGASVRGFRRCMRHVIVVDGTHLKGRFEGTMFVATAQDGNEQVYPIAFGIEAGISKVFPYATHTICCWHFTENVKKRFHKKDVANLIDKAARAYTEFKYNRYMEFIRNMLQRWFHDRHRAAQSMRHRLTDASHLVMLQWVEKCGYMTVNPVDWNIFSVKRSRKQWTVDLAQKTCTCNKFQMDNFPCSHALAAARERNLDFTSLCSDYYKRQTLVDAYSVPIMHVGHPSSWVVPSDIAEQVVLNPKTKRQSGRPMEGRYASFSEMTTTQSCRRCGQSGHNSRRCSNPPLINEGPSRIVP
ncbi:hypothetical protein Dsin_022156, partial [Dipteronia sinensis]